MVAAISVTNSSKNPLQVGRNHTPSTPRPPLLPSKKDNGVDPPRPKSKEVPSRYMSVSYSSSSSSSSSFSSSSRRFPSPLTSRPHTSAPKRSQSAERRPRPATPTPESKQGNAASAPASMFSSAKVLWTSCRSLSVSFQGESFSLPISKIRAAPSPASPNSSNVRRLTPERRRLTTPVRGRGGGDQLENSKPLEQLRWPARIRQSNPMTRSLDCAGENPKAVGFLGSGLRELQQSILVEDERRGSSDRKLHQDFTNCEVGAKALSSKTAPQMSIGADLDNGSAAVCDLTTSDTESVSSGSNSGTQELVGTANGRAPHGGVSVPARFWQETNSRLRRLQDPSSPLSRTTMPKPFPMKKVTQLDSPSSSPRTVSMIQRLPSPVHGPLRHPSPSKLSTSSPSTASSSPLRGIQSPTRMRNVSASSASNLSSNTPSILSFAADVRRWKMAENQIEGAHVLRLLYNRHLQWRFINARADAAFSIQRLTAEKTLCNAWETTSELRHSVTFKKNQLQLLRQSQKLASILKGQLFCLEEWALIDKDHSNSLLGAIEALKASTLRLPIVGGARADIHKLKDAVTAAVDVMQALRSSVCCLLSKVQGMESFVAELSHVATQERELLSQCKDLLSTVASLQVEESSLRTHLLQLRQEPKLTQL